MDARSIVLDDSQGDVLLVVMRGEHDIYTAPSLRDRLDEAIGRTPAGVDRRAQRRDVPGLVDPRRAARGAPGQALERSIGYVVCIGEEPEPGVARILEITGLVPVFPVVGSLDEALTAARATPADA